MKAPILLSKRSQTHEQIHYSIPIAKYSNRFTGKKIHAKCDAKLQVLQNRLAVKQCQLQTLEWNQTDSIFIYNIDNVEEVEKAQEKYTLLKLELKSVPQKEKESKSITFRMMSIPLGREVTAFIRRVKAQIENEIANLPNYVSIEKRQAIVMRSIILKQPQYHQVYRKAQQMNLFSHQNFQNNLQFQRILLAEHPEMIDFKRLKHTLKYQQEKNILIQVLKSKDNKIAKQQNGINVSLVGTTNIDKHSIEEDLQKIKKEGKQWLQGYSSKREFQGINFTGGDEELYGGRDGKQTGESQDRKQNLILKNITITKEDTSEHFFDNNYGDFALGNMRKSTSKLGAHPQTDKMQIEEGEISQNKNRQLKICKKLKIPDTRDIKLQQKIDDKRMQKKHEIKFIDPAYSFQKEQSLTKQTIIWCRLFYFYLKEGGIQKREKELTAIQTELIRLKKSEQEAKMSDLLEKMVEKITQNHLRMKRGQDVY